MQLIFGGISARREKDGEKERYMYDLPFLLPELELAAPEKEACYEQDVWAPCASSQSLSDLIFFSLSTSRFFEQFLRKSVCQKVEVLLRRTFSKRLLLIIRVSAFAQVGFYRNPDRCFIRPSFFPRVALLLWRILLLSVTFSRQFITWEKSILESLNP